MKKNLFILLFIISPFLIAQVGVGTTNPQEQLDVNGAVKIGTTASTNAGTIRWTGTDFEGFDGTSWKSLTSPVNNGVSVKIRTSSNISAYTNFAEYALTLSSTSFNLGGGSYNGATGTYTIPRNGVYNIVANLEIKFTSPVTSMILVFKVYVNGFLYEQKGIQKSVFNAGYSEIYEYNINLNLNANDTVSFKILPVWGAGIKPYINKNNTNIVINKVY